MHKYQSHKIVEAAEIISIDHGFDADGEPCFDIVIEDDETPIFVVSENVGQRIYDAWYKHNISLVDDDAGWLIRYKDGYLSWSPTIQMEEGYDLVQPSSGKPKIAGYRELNEEEVANMNVVKQWGKDMGDVIDIMRKSESHDQRWVSIGATDIQKGLMALTRAIAKPEFF